MDITDDSRTLNVGIGEKVEFGLNLFMLLTISLTGAYMLHEDYKKSKYSWKMKQAFKWF